MLLPKGHLQIGIRWGSLRTKIIAWSFVPTAIILTLVALVGFYAYEQVTENQAIASNREVVRLAAGQLANELGDYSRVLTALARTADLYRSEPVAQRVALQQASNRLLCYVNSDIILLNDFSTAVEQVSRWQPRLLMVGQRWDVEITERWDFRRPDWEEQLVGHALRTNKQQPPNAIDYFVFSKGLGRDILPLAIGRRGWDNWLVWHARALGAPVINATAVVMAIHQNHDYSHHPQGADGVFRGEEARKNRKLIGEWWHLYTTEDATHELTAEGLRPCHRHGWLMVKRTFSHPRSWPRLAELLLTRPFRRAPAK